MELQPGDILLTRNPREEDNSSPGYINHAAIYIGNDKVVESQEGSGVIISPLDEFTSRYNYIIVVRYRGAYNSSAAKIAEVAASKQVPYWKLASVFVFMRSWERGENCVSLARRCFMQTYKIDRKWRVPDDIYYDEKMDLVGNLK